MVLAKGMSSESLENDRKMLIFFDMHNEKCLHFSIDIITFYFVALIIILKNA